MNSIQKKKLSRETPLTELLIEVGFASDYYRMKRRMIAKDLMALSEIKQAKID